MLASAFIGQIPLNNSIFRHHETSNSAQRKNRDASGANLQPFQDKNIQKYGLTRKSTKAIIADEYPLASSLEGGLGVGTGNQRAVIMGATKDDQQGMIST